MNTNRYVTILNQPAGEEAASPGPRSVLARLWDEALAATLPVASAPVVAAPVVVKEPVATPLSGSSADAERPARVRFDRD